MFSHELKTFGTILKTHGVQGELIVNTISDIPGRFDLPGVLFIVIDGIPVPFFVEYSEIISPDSFRVKFDTLNNREEAMKYYNLEVMADKRFVSKCFPKQRVLSVIGFTVKDDGGKIIGKVTELSEIPGNPVISVVNGKKEIMLPVNDDLIIEIDEKNKVIVLRVPDGLV